jgi:hypothetical protein
MSKFVTVILCLAGAVCLGFGLAVAAGSGPFGTLAGLFAGLYMYDGLREDGRPTAEERQEEIDLAHLQG